jgi:hypothetical protein
MSNVRALPGVKITPALVLGGLPIDEMARVLVVWVDLDGRPHTAWSHCEIRDLAYIGNVVTHEVAIQVNHCTPEEGTE